MKAGVETRSTIQPDSFKISALSNGTYEIFASDNLVSETVTDEAGEHTEYVYDAYYDTVELSGYNEAVAALIALKYSYAEEFALARKGAGNEEYTAYLAYVEACKAYAVTVFEKE